MSRNVRKRTSDVHTKKTRTSLRIRAVWSVYCLHQETLHPHQGWFWLDCTNAQANLNLRWSHISGGTFSDMAAFYHIWTKISTNLFHPLMCLNCCRVNPFYTDTRYNDTNSYNDNFNVTKPSLKKRLLIKNMQKHCIKSSSNICFEYLLESSQRGNSNTYLKHMFYEEIRIKQGLFMHIILSIKDSSQQQIHYNGNILERNTVVVTRVHCTNSKQCRPRPGTAFRDVWCRSTRIGCPRPLSMNTW